MIRNERQYRITKAQASEFHKALTELRASHPGDLSPILWQAQVDAVESQYNELFNQISAYEQLQTARPAVIEANSLEELPDALISARIALDLSQKDLADRLGLKEQQIQRYESTNYASASLSRLQEVAQALGVRVTEKVFLPDFHPRKSYLLERLKAEGISESFLIGKLLPSDTAEEFLNAANDDELLTIKVANVLENVFNCKNEDIFGAQPLRLHSAALATARFKVPGGDRGKRFSAYVAYANYLAISVANAHQAQPFNHPLSTNFLSLKSAIKESKGATDLASLVDYMWDIGIPVIPLKDAGEFHGACWRIAGRNSIVIKQNSKSESRWCFDLMHEYYHCTQNPDAESHEWIDGEELSSERQSSPEEKAANIFSGNFLLDGRAEDLVQDCVLLSKGDIKYIKHSVETVARKEGISVSHLANYMAFRLSLQGINWWGAANNLQEINNSPFNVVRDVFMRRFDFGRIDELSSKILKRALFPAGE